ncbi:DHA2 family efflux MFS transporter permease subunit [Vagococcus fluvialis]|jgi:EmrB/QacA subfamily drug resistance transporter|uniref:MFS transporter n=1 Tax=Vagococcus fluvialis TaxID=2738 RepID=A0A369ATP7_9ENTE|nr:DHA2 family efflux MFS transporter permease subunit [Vagococcus fluvialis]MDR2278038.1 DHA2 family efflux MFS transporter permease subunit [Vagococcus sp.]MBO0478656.1 DHA2 family efflux MFS transporter permease subunit [Vagococcus fluvialis]MBO0484500.1 DHA2 family efflux MFS transporter permease subunit [Vagococcus fluvialis]MBO0487312.1 DHA2 family efflux MFS transporter permease subunit [Vagococcus fluvialis]MDT2782528.1 DHA2 family efflux MFS transporter permease subunit [Vagococcus fl
MSQTKQSKQDITVLIILLFGTFLSFLNQTLMNVALPSVMKDFDITAAQGQWLSNGYMLISGVMIPATAFLIDRFKTRHLYLTSMIVFTLGTFIASISINYPMLIAGRMIQALGAGPISPLMTVVIMNMFPVQSRGKAMGFIGLAMNFAPAIGPTLSGWIVQSYDWRSIFYVILPLGIINILVAVFALKNFGEQTYPKFNFLGIVLSTIGLGTLLLGFSNAGDKPWLTFNVAGFVLIGLVVTGLFIYQQTHTKLPMLNFSVFKHRIFTLSSITNFVVIMGLYGGMILLPLYIQNVRGVSPMTSGMVLLPGAIIMAIMSPITGALYDRIGARYLSFTGLIILSIGTFMFTLIDMNTTVTYLAIMQGVRSFGLGLALMPIQTDALNDLPLELMSHGSAMYNTIRQIAGSLGTALLVTIMSISTSNFAAENVGISIEEATLHGIQIAYIVVTAISVVAAVMCLKLSKKAK